MLNTLLFFIVFILAISICLHHYSMSVQIHKTSENTVQLIRQAAEHSIMASNTVNPILSLVESSRAVQIIDTLHREYGVAIIDEKSKVKTDELLSILKCQKNRTFL